MILLIEFIFLLFNIFNIFAATNLDRLPSHNFRIVGGQPADKHEFKYIVDLQVFGVHYCGGSILNERWILTAAHCVYESTDYVAVAGDHDISSIDGFEQFRNVINIIIHPEYNSETFDYDIALMELDYEFNSIHIEPVSLPESGYEPSGDAVVAGWGALTEGGTSPRNLFKVSVPLVDQDTCNMEYNPSGYHILPSMICAGSEGKDSCLGDSGGPMMCLQGSNVVQCGIVSWGIGCGRPGFPGVYARNSHFISWINQNIN